MDHAKHVSNLLTNSLYSGAPKKKVASNVFNQFMEVSYRLAQSHALLIVLQIMKQGNREGWTPEEIQGQIELDFKEAWSALSTSKIGHLVYLPLNIEDIINSEDPINLILKGMVTK